MQLKTVNLILIVISVLLLILLLIKVDLPNYPEPLPKPDGVCLDYGWYIQIDGKVYRCLFDGTMWKWSRV